MIRQIKSGEGWRLGWNPAAAEFSGLVSGDRWAMELTGAEFRDFCRCARRLDDTMQAMAEALMAEESLTCEQETSLLWLEAAGFPTAYSLRFILLSGRGGEGEWPARATRELAIALKAPPFASIGSNL